MKTKSAILIFFIVIRITGYSQYLPNPSFEGIPGPNFPPPGWVVCNTATSTPDVQPGSFGVYLPPSNGNTYLGMTTRDDGTWEDVQSTLMNPLSQDSCYHFQIDLAFQQDVSTYIMSPVVLKIYGANVMCNKSNLLWQSPAISNTDWLTYDFYIQQQAYDITNLVMEVYYVSSFPYWGYMLMDNIRINQTPKVDLGNDTTLFACTADSLVLSAGSGFAQYLWQDGSTDSTFVVTGSGTYWVLVVNGAGCAAIDSIDVIFEEYIEMETQMFDSTFVCEGQVLNISVGVTNGKPPYSYIWPGLPDTLATALVSPDSTTYYHVIVTDDCGNTAMDSIKVIVKQKPVIDLGNDTLICINGDYTLHAGSGFIQYLWQDGSTDSVLSINSPGIYWVQVTSVFGCSATDSINISVFPAIPLNIGNDTTLCLGDSVTFNAGNGFVSYIWQDNSTGSSYTATITGTYWVTVFDNNGCSATDSVNATFLSFPDIDLGPDFSFCSGEEQILTPGTGYESYLWQDNSTGEFYTVTQTGLYYVTVSNGCADASDSVYVEVLPSPEIDLGADTTICMGQTLVLEPVGQFVSYVWQDNSQLSFYEVSSSGYYSVTVESNNGCTAQDGLYVNVSDPQVNLGDDTFVCSGDSILLDAGTGYISYLWQDGSGNETYTVDTGGIYSVTVMDEYSCQGTGSINVEQFQAPNPDLGENKGYCAGDTIHLNAPQGNYNFYWNGQPGGTSLVVSSPGTYTLTLVNDCDSVSDQVFVQEYPVPDVNLGEDRIILPGETIQLDAGDGYDTYLWQDGTGGEYYLITENNIDPNNPYYSVVVTEGPCKSSDSVKVELFKVWVPKVITLNGDGKNDLFQPDMEKWQGINKHKIIVFNRWGETVWESEDFPSGWDGKQNGSYVADGTYYWILDVYYGSQNLKQTLKGSLTILSSEN